MGIYRYDNAIRMDIPIFALSNHTVCICVFYFALAPINNIYVAQAQVFTDSHKA